MCMLCADAYVYVVCGVCVWFVCGACVCSVCVCACVRVNGVGGAEREKERVLITLSDNHELGHGHCCFIHPTTSADLC